MNENDEIYQVQFYRSLRVGWLKKDDDIGFILNPFNFTYYGSEKGNIIANKIIVALTEEFKDKDPLSIETLMAADDWVKQNQNQFTL